MSMESDHNYPEGYEKKPWCPNTKIINICVDLAGVNIPPPDFCTEILRNAQWADGKFDWLERGDFYPRTSCVEVNQILVDQLKIVGKELEAPDDLGVTHEINGAVDLKAKQEIFESYKISRDAYDQRQAIVDRWRKVIFETCCSTTADEQNEHFRQIASAEELSLDEITGKVKLFISALNKITGYKEIYISDGARNCPQSPRYRHFGPWID